MTAAELHAVPDEPQEPASEFDQDPLNNPYGEQCVLGAMMLTPSVVDDIAAMLRPVDFYQPRHAVIFEAILRLREQGQPTDLMLVGSALMESGDIQKVGGPAYLHNIVANTPSGANGVHYAEKIAFLAYHRRIAELGSKFTQMGYGVVKSGLGTIDDTQAMVQKMFNEATEIPGRGGLLVRIPDLLSDAFDAVEANNKPTDEGERPLLISTGLVDLDQAIGGWRPGQLILVAARPGMGKSVAATGFGLHAAKLGVPVAMFSLEMTRTELMYRILAAEAGVALKRLRDGGMDDLDWARLTGRTGALSDLPFWLSEERNLTMARLHSEMVKHKRRHGLGLGIVDFAQLMKAGGRFESRQQEVAYVARGLKNLAGELGIPLIVPTQLNRENEKRQDKRPQIGDLRESGELEQAADVVLLLHREDYYDTESPMAGEADFIIGKARDAQKETITVAAQLHYSRFVSMAVGLNA